MKDIIEPQGQLPSVQTDIEAVMKQYFSESRWESITLFSSEGLKMAGYGQSWTYDQDTLLEFAFSQIETVKLLGDDLPVKEIIMHGKERTRLVFRYFEAIDELMVLSAVITGRKGYRRAMTQLIRTIRDLGS